MILLQDYMKARTFNGLMPHYNHQWASEVLDMTTNHPGPDLLSLEKLVELKFFIRNPKPHPEVQNYGNKKKWTTNDKQLDYSKEWERKGYWGMGFYELTKPIRSIYSNSSNLEQYVISRELFIVQWEWMNQFPRSHTSGIRSDGTPWNDFLRYPKIDKIPETELTYEVEGGEVHLTRGVDLNDFKLEEIENKPVLINEEAF